jgi:hypothetical protein
LAGINGWLPQRLQKDLLWNRTVNLTGGAGKNLEMDLVNEMLNKEFKGIADILPIKQIGNIKIFLSYMQLLSFG